MLPLLLALAIAQAPAPAPSQALPELVVTEDDTVVTQSCVVRLPATPIRDAAGDGVLRITGSDIVVELAGPLRGAPSDADPDTFTGTGIEITGAGVTLRGARVLGFRTAIHARGADRLVLEDCDVSGNFRQRLASTAEREASEDWLWPHDNDTGEWRTRYGAGIYVERSTRATVRRCRARAGQNGLVLDRVTESLVYDNDFSFLSGWGVALWRSERNFVTRNALDFCVRGYSHGVYNRGQDSAGLLLFEQCSGNVIAENSMTHGGDGIFAFSGREALGEAPAPSEDFDYLRRGNNDNVIARNDLSYAAAHGLELTFAFGNEVFENRLVGNAICGMWGGYSRDTLVAKNLFAENGDAGYGLERGGINIEHGQRNVLLANDLRSNACGVHLWWDADPPLAELPWTRANGFGSGDNVLIGNRFEGDELAIQLRAAGPTTLAGNEMVGVGRELEVDEASRLNQLERLESDWQAPPFPVFGDAEPIGARERLAGREHIIITEWGPYDWESPLLRRVGASASRERFRVLGGDVARFEVDGDVQLTSDGAEAELSTRPGGVGAATPYRLRAHLDSGELLEAEGLLVSWSWNVRFFPWTDDPREAPDAWRRSAEGGLSCRLASLDLEFGSGGPASLDALSASAAAANLPTDRFGTLAEASLRLTPGRWTLHTVSDDGIRVWIDDELVIDDWTHHASRAHAAGFELDEARSVDVRVEHFELDGAAVLRAWLAQE